MKKLLLVAAAICAVAASSAQADVIANNASGGSIGSFGYPDSQTYGQVFTAPVTGTMTSFTLWLNGGVGALAGGVGTWNGSNSFSYGAGSPVNLFESAAVTSSGAGAYTFTPNIAVTAGSVYVAYLTTNGISGANNAVSMPLGDNSDANIGYFVWNNGSDPRGNASWNYFGDYGEARFTATFEESAVPEPASWAMMIGGFALAGAAMRRRQAAAVRFA